MVEEVAPSAPDGQNMEVENSKETTVVEKVPPSAPDGQNMQVGNSNGPLKRSLTTVSQA